MFWTALTVIGMGLIVGSFLGAYTYRAPRGISVAKGRSFCPSCKSKIEWYDNIPLLSYILLRAKCRRCKKRIGKREPLIELFTMATFLFIYLASFSCSISSYFISSPFCLLTSGSIPLVSLIFALIVGAIFIVIFVIDLENQLILDENLFLIFVLSFFYLLFFKNDIIFENLLAGLLASLFFFFLHAITLGKGMGLGDVKLALIGGVLLGSTYTAIWIFLSFIIGGILGAILILFKKVKLGKQIPFGPFMIFALGITMLFGDKIINIVIPF